MKRIAFLFALLFILMAGASAQQKLATEMDAASALHGKPFLLDYYQKTFATLKNSVEGLSPAQLQFKPAADRWSISECLEHIVLTERTLFDFSKKAMESPANPERRAEVKVTDEAVIDGINDRSHKAKAGAELTGKGIYNSPRQALEALQNDRKAIFSYIDNVAADDLRSHISDSPFGPIDAYQWFLFIPGHTSRHTLQINEVKADKNFPKQ